MNYKFEILANVMKNVFMKFKRNPAAHFQVRSTLVTTTSKCDDAKYDGSESNDAMVWSTRKTNAFTNNVCYVVLLLIVFVF